MTVDLFFAFDNHGLNVTIRLVKEDTLKIIFVDSCVYECYCVEWRNNVRKNGENVMA